MDGKPEAIHVNPLALQTMGHSVFAHVILYKAVFHIHIYMYIYTYIYIHMYMYIDMTQTRWRGKPRSANKQCQPRGNERTSECTKARNAASAGRLGEHMQANRGRNFATCQSTVECTCDISVQLKQTHFNLHKGGGQI